MASHGLLTKARARRIWLRAQRLDETAPFGAGAQATQAAIEHLGYVQIDTIHVIERCHHHILFTRIPDYARAHLHQAQTLDKSVFEYRAHALAYLPTKTLPFFAGRMKAHWRDRSLSSVEPGELRKLLARIRKDGAITLRDIEDETLIETDGWASRKPSAQALKLAFYGGRLTVSERTGILKTYELSARHFDWEKAPRPASERAILAYLLDRALTAQGIVSLDSVCYMDAPRKKPMRALIERRVRAKELVPVEIEGAGKVEHWARPEALDALPSGANDGASDLVHILSPFDPLIIQRKRLRFFFDYEHVFEAYVPKPKRKFGYFGLPVLVGDQIAAVIDLKTDREKEKLLIQKWTWLPPRANRSHKAKIEEALDRFERFQLGK